MNVMSEERSRDCNKEAGAQKKLYQLVSSILLLSDCVLYFIEGVKPGS